MPKWLRALLAGYGAKKLGGGCFSTISYIHFNILCIGILQCTRQQAYAVESSATSGSGGNAISRQCENFFIKVIFPDTCCIYTIG